MSFKKLDFLSSLVGLGIGGCGGKIIKSLRLPSEPQICF